MASVSTVCGQRTRFEAIESEVSESALAQFRSRVRADVGGNYYYTNFNEWHTGMPGTDRDPLLRWTASGVAFRPRDRIASLSGTIITSASDGHGA